MGIIVGCDIGKDRFEAAHLEGARPRCVQVENKLKAIQRFAGQLPPGSIVGMEATGQLHELLARVLVEHGHTVFVINPRWIRRYGQSVGMRGKTDRTDAALIARYVAAEQPHLRPYEPPSAQQEELRQLLLRRCSVVKLRMSTRQSLGAQGKGVVRQLDQVLQEIEGRIEQIIGSAPQWRELARRLATQPGVGRIVAAYLLQVLTRFAFTSADAFVAHTGLDPRPNDSGQKQGRRRLTHHGDASLRTMLFMAAMSASKSAQWRAIYQAQRQKGLAGTAALVAVARKIARVAYSLFKSGQNYDASRLATAAPA